MGMEDLRQRYEGVLCRRIRVARLEGPGSRDKGESTLFKIYGVWESERMRSAKRFVTS